MLHTIIIYIFLGVKVIHVTEEKNLHTAKIKLLNK